MSSNRAGLRAVEAVPNGSDGESGELDNGGAIPAGTVIPHCLDTEALVISHCFEHGPLDALLPKHFYSDANQRVYGAIQACALRGDPTDPVAVARELYTDDRLRQIGGTSYLAALVHQPAAARIESHAEAIREYYRRRVLAAAALELRAELCNGLSAREAWTRFKAICEGANE